MTAHKPIADHLYDARNEDHAELAAGAAIASEYGGRIGVAIMLLVAVFIGFALAVQS